MSDRAGGDILRAARQWMPATLVSQGHMAAMVMLADQLAVPAGLLIECPLSGSTTSADLSLSFGRIGPGGERTRLTPASLPRGGEWDALRPFITAWATRSGPLGAEVQSVWFEFDLRTAQDTAVPVPNVFFGTSRGSLSREAVIAGLDLLADHQAAHRAMADLPLDAHVLFAGVMLAREPQAIRFCLNAPAESSTSMVAGLIGHTPRLVMQVEAGTAPSTRAGFEVYQPREQRGRSDAWRPLLQRLVEAGVASDERCAAALQWPGYGYDDSVSPRVVTRWINHIKLTYEAGALVEAKVYLQCGTAWTPPAGP